MSSTQKTSCATIALVVIWFDFLTFDGSVGDSNIFAYTALVPSSTMLYNIQTTSKLKTKQSIGIEGK